MGSNEKLKPVAALSASYCWFALEVCLYKSCGVALYGKECSDSPEFIDGDEKSKNRGEEVRSGYG